MSGASTYTTKECNACVTCDKCYHIYLNQIAKSVKTLINELTFSIFALNYFSTTRITKFHAAVENQFHYSDPRAKLRLEQNNQLVLGRNVHYYINIGGYL